MYISCASLHMISERHTKYSGYTLALAHDDSFKLQGLPAKLQTPFAVHSRISNYFIIFHNFDVLKSLNQQGVLWLTRVCQVAWCSGRSPKDWKTGVLILMHKSETGVKALTTVVSLSLACLDKCMTSALSKHVMKALNQSWIIPSAVFVPAIPLQTQFSLSSKFSRCIWSMPKTSAHVLSTSRKYTIGSIGKSYGECSGSTMLTANCCYSRQTTVFLLRSLCPCWQR